MDRPYICPHCDHTVVVNDDKPRPTYCARCGKWISSFVQRYRQTEPLHDLGDAIEQFKHTPIQEEDMATETELTTLIQRMKELPGPALLPEHHFGMSVTEIQQALDDELEKIRSRKPPSDHDSPADDAAV